MNLYNAQSSSSKNGELNSITINQNNSAFACGTNTGFRIFSMDPFKEVAWRNFHKKGGIGIVEMLYRCNLIALVGGGVNPRYPPNKVYIWDDHQGRNVGELAFESDVKAIRLRRDRIVVVLKYDTFIYRFSDLKLLDKITTLANPKGLISINTTNNNCILAVPGLSKGRIRIELYDIHKATLINAHETELCIFALNNDGSKICSASEKGTLIRVWDCATGDQLKELRRGADRAEIYCLTFNYQSTFLACSSDKGTIHIFSLTGNSNGINGDDDEGDDNNNNNNNNSMMASRSSSIFMDQQPSTPSPSSSSTNQNQNLPPLPPSSQSSSSQIISSQSGNNNNNNNNNNNDQNNETSSLLTEGNLRSGLAFMRTLVPGLVPKYFGSEWSYAQIRGLESKCVCAFADNNNNYNNNISNEDSAITLNVICADASFLVYHIPPKNSNLLVNNIASFKFNTKETDS